MNRDTDIIIEIEVGFLRTAIDSLLFTASWYTFHREHEYTLYVPEFFWSHYMEHLFNQTGKMEPSPNMYKGFKIVWGYEPKIILAHKDHVILHREGTYYEVKILGKIKNSI